MNLKSILANSKGFSLPELLATIVILTVILSLGVGSYLSVTTRVKETSFDNKIKYIETAAANYGNENQVNAVFVDTLIQEGYIDADNEKGEIFDPRDNRLLNCYIVSLYTDDDNIYGHFTDEDGLLENRTCDSQKLSTFSTFVTIQKYSSLNNDGTKWSNTPIGKEDWTHDNVVLIVEVADEIKDMVSKISFISNANTIERTVNHDFDLQNKLFVKASRILNANYKVTVETSEINENNEEEKHFYSASIPVRIDKQKPIVFNDDTQTVSNVNETYYSSSVKTRISDKSGSGVYGYYLTAFNQECSLNKEDYIHVVDDQISTRRMMNNYRICLIDNTGNTTDPILMSD